MTAALLVAAIALAFAAGGLLLWQHARLRTQQQASASFVDAQVREVLRPLAPAAKAAKQGDVKDDTAWSPKRSLEEFFMRAGVADTPQLRVKLIVPGIVLVALALVFGGAMSAGAALLLYVMLAAFRFWMKANKRHRQMVHQLPLFLDAMVRLMSIGNSLGSAFQTTAPMADAPLREVLERASGLTQAGVDLDLALHQQAQAYRFPELELVAAVIGVAGRVGGRADMVLERMAAFMRDLEQAQHELVALSAETRMSAWVMGLLPIGIGLFIITFNNKMFVNMWADPIGKYMLLGAAALEVFGTLWLVRLAKSV
jgi:tight adherence protein B